LKEDILSNNIKYIAKGLLQKSDFTSTEYQIINGLDLTLSQESDIAWGTFNLKTLHYIENNVAKEDLEEIIQSLHAEDAHWSWFNKSINYTDDGFEWFYMIVNNEVQCICLVFQPKESIINDGDIFYIEYIAVAPWNRETLINKRKYFHVARTMIANIIEYLENAKGLTPAFSLHSLPQSIGYYEHIGMVHCPAQDKTNLRFFELPLEYAQKLIKEHNDEKIC
jgi:hypothetical protein